MLDTLYAAFKAGTGLDHVSAILYALTQIVMHFEEDYVKDGDAKNDIIDSICEILQAHKDPIDNNTKKP